jgi:hypothetical protein
MVPPEWGGTGFGFDFDEDMQKMDCLGMKLADNCDSQVTGILRHG